jgi:hypothetical protein
LLLARSVKALSTHTDKNLTFDNHDTMADRAELIDKIVLRPAKLLISEPLVILITTLSAISWAMIYLFTECLTEIYQDMGFSRTTSALPFVAIGIGVLFSILPRFQDMRIAHVRKLRGEALEPEDKLTGSFVGVIALALGLWWFAWSIPPAVVRISWVVPTVSLTFIGFAVNELAYTLSSYLADSYTVYSATAFAALAFVRAIVSGIAPLLAREMYQDLTTNVATTIIAVIATLFWAAPYILVVHGRRLRRLSRFAKHSLEVHERTRVEVD